MKLHFLELQEIFKAHSVLFTESPVCMALQLVQTFAGGHAVQVYGWIFTAYGHHLLL